MNTLRGIFYFVGVLEISQLYFIRQAPASSWNFTLGLTLLTLAVFQELTSLSIKVSKLFNHTTVSRSPRWQFKSDYFLN